MQNFLVYGDEEQSVELDNQGLVGVQGINLDAEGMQSNGGGKCLSGDTLVWDVKNNTQITLKEFVENKVTSTFGYVGKRITPVEVTNWHTLGKKPMLHLTNNVRTQIKLATTHPMLTGKGIVQAKDLAVGDWVAEADRNHVHGETDLFWTQVKEIESIPDEVCYDLTVDSEEHLYLANNFVVHNSSSLEAIVYGLFGELGNGVGGDSVVNRVTGKNLKVTLSFEQNGHEYRVERYRKHSKFKNKVLLFEDEEEITQSSLKLTNERLKDIINLDMETYLQSVMFGLGTSKQFTESTDKEKKIILEDIANIAIYKKAQEVAKETAKDIDGQVHEASMTVDQKQNMLTTLQAVETEQQGQIKHYEDYHVYLQGEVTKAEAQVANVQAPTMTLEEAQAHLQTAQDAFSNFNGVPSTQNSQKLAQMRQIKATDEQQVQNFEKSLREAKNAFNRIAESDLPTCAYCGHVLDEEHKESEMKRQQVIISESTEGMKPYQEQLAQIEVALPILEQQTKAENEANESIHSTQQSLQSAINSMNANVQQVMSQQQIASTARMNLDSAKNALAQHSKSKPKIESKQAEITTLTTELTELQTNLSVLTEQQEKYRQVIEVYSDRGVKSHALDLVMPYLNQQANYYLGELTDNTISVTITTTSTAKNGNVSDKLEVTVDNLVGGSEYELNSKGERRRIDLSIALALQDYVMSRTNTQTNFVAYDEVFDGLDREGIERVMNILTKRLATIPTIFVITHNDDLKELFENTLTITKQQGVATIETKQIA